MWPFTRTATARMIVKSQHIRYKVYKHRGKSDGNTAACSDFQLMSSSGQNITATENIRGQNCSTVHTLTPDVTHIGCSDANVASKLLCLSNASLKHHPKTHTLNKCDMIDDGSQTKHWEINSFIDIWWRHATRFYVFQPTVWANKLLLKDFCFILKRH